MHVCIIGLGLIGGSLAKALKRARFSSYISVVDTDEGSLRNALASHIADEVAGTVDAIATRPDLVIFAMPVSQYQKPLKQIAPWLQAGTIATDVGSTKMSVVRDLADVFGTAIPPFFVPGHPIAGRECSGLDAADAGLFEHRRVILTPLNNTDAGAIEQVQRMWLATGAVTEIMDAQHHDEVLAATSHLPHTLAFALVYSLSAKSEKEEIFRYAAGGFADFTRIASSNPQLWRDICIANRQCLAQAMDHFMSELRVLQQGLQNNNAALLEEHFSAAKRARDTFCGKQKVTAGE